MKKIILLSLVFLPIIAFSMGEENYERLYYNLLEENQNLKIEIRKLKMRSNPSEIISVRPARTPASVISKKNKPDITQQQISKSPIFIKKRDIVKAAKEEIDNSCTEQLNKLKRKLDIAIKTKNNISIKYYKWRYTKQLRRCRDEKSRYKY